MVVSWPPVRHNVSMYSCHDRAGQYCQYVTATSAYWGRRYRHILSAKQHETMMTSSNGNIFRVTGPLCGEFTGHRWIPPNKGQWPGALMFFFDLCVNKHLNKQSRRWWFETPSRSSWRHCNDTSYFITIYTWHRLVNILLCYFRILTIEIC